MNVKEELPWLENYPDSVPKDINPHEYESLAELFEECFSKYSDLTAYECMGKSLSFKELGEQSAHFGAFLQQELGLRKGDRIAIQLPNLLQYPIVAFGALRAGLIIVNTNPLYTAREMEHQFKDSGVKAIVILANFACNLEKIIDKTAIEHVIITEIGDRLGGLKKTIVNFVVKNIKKMVPTYHLPQAIKLNDALSKGRSYTLKQPEIKGSDTACLQYTGGTTGISKGAILSHTNLVANIEQMVIWMKVRLNEREEVIITALPLYHIYAFTVNCLGMLKLGAKNILITNPRDMKSFLKDLKKYPFTVITGVNTLYNALLNQTEFTKLDFSHLKVVSAGGMAVQKVVAEKFKQVTGIGIAEGYGLTETSPVLTTNRIDGKERIGTIGLPVPSTKLIIADDNEQEVPIGEAGEIYAKGPQVMSGYWEKEEESKNAFSKDGWFKTGDIGIMDNDGFVKIIDRKKEMINVSGFNVYPNDIEDTVAAHPKVMEVGAIGVPDEKSTEVVKICVVKKDPSLTAQELKEYCKENMTPYKVPKFIEFRDELPKSNVGKILRRLLKEGETKV
ncbi:long-chain acyl-CoA synthetase [Catalinimonas alkaloidigena]|uniref:AMP-binding protein n=1 Tax=Catalinimonas alkaloidigena TaxID=1075417 RepID=UPI002406D329|nr:AMP-binding protein [Catalinimonas alkaloidigena]MDF9795771.1 long-chain acyl-CoA synthetase [Catalinimonas alkaloidigena]